MWRPVMSCSINEVSNSISGCWVPGSHHACSYVLQGLFGLKMMDQHYLSRFAGYIASRLVSSLYMPSISRSWNSPSRTTLLLTVHLQISLDTYPIPFFTYGTQDCLPDWHTLSYSIYSFHFACLNSYTIAIYKTYIKNDGVWLVIIWRETENH